MAYHFPLSDLALFSAIPSFLSFPVVDAEFVHIVFSN
jgi:hypothetical protein